MPAGIVSPFPSLPRAAARNAAGSLTEPSKTRSTSCKAPRRTARDMSTSTTGTRDRCRPPTSLPRITTSKKRRTNLADIVDRALRPACQIAKVATQVNRWDDNRRLLDLLVTPCAKAAHRRGHGRYRTDHAHRRTLARKFSQLCRVHATSRAGTTHRPGDAGYLQVPTDPAIDKTPRNSRNARRALALTCPAQSRLRHGESRLCVCEAARTRSQGLHGERASHRARAASPSRSRTRSR